MLNRIHLASGNNTSDKDQIHTNTTSDLTYVFCAGKPSQNSALELEQKEVKKKELNKIKTNFNGIMIYLEGASQTDWMSNL